MVRSYWSLQVMGGSLESYEQESNMLWLAFFFFFKNLIIFNEV